MFATYDKQATRIEARADAAHQKYVLRDAHALLWKGWAREFWEEKREAWRTLRSLRDAARSACDREMGEGHRYPENVKVVKRSCEEAPKHPGNANTTWTILSVLEWVVARIDGKEG